MGKIGRLIGWLVCWLVRKTVFIWLDDTRGYALEVFVGAMA